MLTDERMIEIISRRLDCECPFAKAASILNRQSWTDIVEHLWKDKDLKVSLMKAYATEINHARAQELLSESDSLPL